MVKIWTLALAEWRYWQRSKLAISVLLTGFILMSGSALLTAYHMDKVAHQRAHLQSEAEEAFTNQPDRHPHRMVHYGHYVFRTPPPLALVDPGVDAYTGTSIFLEGHRQNTAMFADRQEGTGLAHFGLLSPAFLMQILSPLLIILIGYSVVTREREGGTLALLMAQGASPAIILSGKGLALGLVCLLMLSPIVVGTGVAVLKEEALGTGLIYVLGYAVYLFTWCAITVFVSARLHTRSASFGALIALWVFTALLLPPVASTAAAMAIKAPGKIETDFALIEEINKIGDGHNAGDPSFAALKANLLAQYDVESIEELPVNFRGVVAEVAEAELSTLLNSFAEKRMSTELAQARVARYFGWLSPVISTREFSMAVAGVDLETHHRFLREAEKIRYDFVQRLNKAQAEQTRYVDDINRSVDPEAEKRTRVSAENWKMLQAFQFSPSSGTDRLLSGANAFMKMLVWLCGALALCATFGRRSL